MDRNRIICGHVLDVLTSFPSNSIDVVVTSPPYYGLRDYGENCSSVWGDWTGQLGLEPHPNLYVDHIRMVFREIKRVLKSSGSLWLDIGDTYFQKRPDNGRGEVSESERGWLQAKQKLMIPARVAIGLQTDGWILRQEIVWHKVNHMPSSVKDRLASSWESVYFFVKAPRYFFDLNAIRKAPAPASLIRNQYGGAPGKTLMGSVNRAMNPGERLSNFGVNPGDVWKIEPDSRPQQFRSLDRGFAAKTGGWNDYKKRLNLYGKWAPTGERTPSDVWSLTTEGFKGEHFACFPQKLVRRILDVAGPKKVCSSCGEPKTPIIKPSEEYKQFLGKSLNDHVDDLKRGMRIERRTPGVASYVTVGWDSCSCQKPFIPGLVLDPFIGSGTTGLVARKMGLDYLGIELKPEYVSMANKRLATIPQPLEKFYQT